MAGQFVAMRPAQAAPGTRPATWVRRLAGLGGAALLLGSLAIGSLHLLPATGGMNPLTEPISKYALSGAGWLFDTGVLVLALGMGALLSALVLGRSLAPSSTAFAAMVVCSVGLVVLVIFPDETSGRTFTPTGWTHWVAAMVAFGGLPVAPLLIARRHRSASGCSRLPGAARLLSIAAAVGFVLLLIGSILEVVTVLPVWRVGGVVERTLAGSEIGAALLLALWAWRGCACRHRAAPDSGCDGPTLAAVASER